ncbi:MAG: hypothetical protein RLZZ198_1878 [Bacteroidota bacterium]|jgi:hypothetical protein
MLRKVLLVVFLLILVGWSSFAFYSLIDSSEEQSYLSLFNPKADELIIALHHPKDFELENLEVDCNQKNIDVFTSLMPNIKDLSSAFISKKRNILVLQTQEKWSIKRVKNTFERGIYSFDLTGPNTFQFGKYLGKFKGNELILYYYDIDLYEEKSYSPWRIDPQSTYSIVYLLDSLNKTRDVYVKSDYKISYTSSDFKRQKKILIDDLSLFGSLIPKETKSYQFYERNYLLETDSEFRRSPIKNLVKNGVIIIEVNQKPVFIFDMKQEVTLSEYLNDFFHKLENNQERASFTNFPICKSFNLTLEGEGIIKPKNILAYSVDGFGFLTTDESALDAVLLELEMRKSLNTSMDNITLFKAPLPKTVSQRSLSSRNSSSISWVENRLVETKIEVLGSQKSSEQIEETKNYFTMNPGLPVLSFCALSGRGNVIMEVDKELIGYKNGSLKWRKPLKSSLSNQPKSLATNNLENEFILLPHENHLEIIDKMGRPQYEINGVFEGDPIQCIVNKQAAFGIQGKEGIYFYATSSGKQLKRFVIMDKIAAWNIISTSGKLTIGIKTNNQLLNIDYTTGKRQTIKANSADFISFTRSGFIQRGPNGMQEVIGSKTINIQVPSYWKFSGEVKLGQDIGQLFHDGKSIVLTVKGKVRWNKAINHSEISELILPQNVESLFIVRDALENKLYFWDFQGNLLDEEERPGQRTIQLTPLGLRGSSITTYLNDFIIQFNY